tara:strand:+ start:64563 stop:65501 length:939 start_codon:yes stop_codon:yes gene_type:complete
MEMEKIAVYYDDIFLAHDTGIHPENKERLQSITTRLKSSDIADWLDWIVPPVATVDQLNLIHDMAYIEHVKKSCTSGGALDVDTVISHDSWSAALHAAGAAVSAVHTVLSGQYPAAYCAIRPPGHHAERHKSMGFCLFNNVAIAARHSVQNLGLGKVAIIDFDVHHGNGTQNAFYSDPSVFVISLHQRNHYPGTGLERESGEGNGEGTTLNCLMDSGSGNLEYLEVFDTKIIPTLKKFSPELVLISAGFDGHRDDPLGGIDLTETGYSEITRRIKLLAGDFGHGRVVSLLEGGYNPQALAKSVEAHLKALIE